MKTNQVARDLRKWMNALRTLETGCPTKEHYALIEAQAIERKNLRLNIAKGANNCDNVPMRWVDVVMLDFKSVYPPNSVKGQIG